MWIWIIAAIVATGMLGVWVHHLFEGEWLPHDIAREWRLSRRALTALDRSQNAPERTKIVISLTTIPSRIDHIELTLKSLLDQSLAPSTIQLNIPFESKREGRAYVVPQWLLELESVTINRCEDFGPATKLIPALDLPGDTPILVVDDDRIYPRWLVAHYAAAMAAQPEAALTLAGSVVPRDLTDRATTIWSNLMMLPPTALRAPRLRGPRQVDYFKGVWSYLVRPAFFDLAEMRDMNGEPEALFFVDDVRSSALCNAPIFAIPAPSLSFIPWQSGRALQRVTLGEINDIAPEERNNTIAFRHYKDKWRVGGPDNLR